MADKIGVFICTGYGIAEALDVEALCKVATDECGVPFCKTVDSCEGPGLGAINEEIQKAAEDLATRLDDSAEEETKEMSLASVHELDITAQMQGRNDDEIGDDDDTGVEPTVDMEAEDKTVEMAEDKTVEMPEDNTVEMPKRGKAG